MAAFFSTGWRNEKWKWVSAVCFPWMQFRLRWNKSCVLKDHSQHWAVSAPVVERGHVGQISLFQVLLCYRNTQFRGKMDPAELSGAELSFCNRKCVLGGGRRASVVTLVQIQQPTNFSAVLNFWQRKAPGAEKGFKSNFRLRSRIRGESWTVVQRWNWSSKDINCSGTGGRDVVVG